MSKRKIENNPLEVSANVLIQLGSLVVHYEELTSPHGHPLDKATIDSIRNSPEVAEWFDAMNKYAFLPVKRNK